MIDPAPHAPRPLRSTASTQALTHRASPHAPPNGRPQWPFRSVRRGLALFALATVLGCEPGASGASGAAAQRAVERELAELYEAWPPPPPEATSDVADRALRRRREVMDELHAGSPALGRAALAEYEEQRELAIDVRMALLEVAAYCAPEETLPTLETLVLEYGPPLQVREHAVHLLGETSPERALEILTGILREPRHSQTYPSREGMLQAWISASRRVGAPMDELLVQVATNLFQPPRARYLAIETLASVDSPRARQALEEVLVESSSDGYQRRKAAQAILAGQPRAEACAILQRVAERESEEGFLEFLADMLARNCP